MTVQWERVHVFVSSTFKDMHAERDYLVKQVFPRLQEWCERRKLRLVDIDLRWGVTEADASQNKRVVQVCLERIDACRPFFLCFLGQRRGWVPARDDISLATFAAYPDLERFAGDTSVTELEILHAFVSPLHSGVHGRAEHSFFYLRQPEYLASLPADPPQLRPVYTNEGSAHPGEDDAQLSQWRDVEMPRTGRPVHPYEARWDAGASTPEIGLPLQCPSTAERGSAARETALGRWSRQWAQAGVRVDEDGEIGDPIERDKAERFNARLTRGRLAEFTCLGRPLAETILADLQAAIEGRYPDHVETPALTPLQRELDQQAQFLQAAGEGFIERTGDFAELDRYAQDASRQPFLLTAPGGLGKTSLLARWIDRTQLNLEAGEGLHYRFIGASDGSTTVDALLRSLLVEIKEVAGKLPDEEIPAEPDKLRAALLALLKAAGARGRTVLVLDGLNQLESGLGDLAWLPLALPPGVKLVASFKRGEPQAEAYFEQLCAGGQAILAKVHPFESLEDRRKLVEAYLLQYLKELDERHLEALVRSEGAGNPLYLKVVLAELRVFGAFGDLGAKIRGDFGATPVSAFDGLLRRLETDPAYSPVRPELLVPRLFGWLAHARTGLTVEELSGLLLRDGLLPGDEAGRQRASEAVHSLLRQVRPYLARREGRAGFFYESLELAVRHRYVRDDGQKGAHSESRTARAWHTSLAEYFGAQSLRVGPDQAPNRRKLAELAYQQAHAGMAEPLQRTLWDYSYLEARLEGSDVQALIADYDLANLEQAGLGPEARQRLHLLQWALRLSAHTLTAGSAQLAGQLIGRLLHEKAEQIRTLLRAAAGAGRSAWLHPLRPSLLPPGGPLSRTIQAHADPYGALALFDGGRKAVTSAEDGNLIVWDLETGRELGRLVGHRDAVQDVVVFPNGRRAVSASKDRTLRVWDLDSGQTLRTLVGHSDRVSCLALLPDRRRVLSGSWDRTLRLWDVDSGDLLQTLEGHTDRVNDVAVAADGRHALSCSSDKTLGSWDLESGRKLRMLSEAASAHSLALFGDKGAISVAGEHLTIWNLETGEQTLDLHAHLGPIAALAVYARGRRVVSGGLFEGDIRVWNPETGEQLLAIERMVDSVTGLAVTDDGRRLVAAGDDGSLRLLTLELGNELLHTVRGRRALAVSRDGRRVLSTSRVVEASWAWDRVEVWDLWSGRVERTLRGHKGGITRAAIFDEGRRAITASQDPSWGPSLKVWDLESGSLLTTLVGHEADVWAVAVFPDGRRAVSGAWDNTVRIWDLETGREMHVLSGHGWPVSTVAVCSGGEQVISGYDDGTLKVWDADRGTELLTLTGHTDRVSAVGMSPDGTRALSGSDDNALRLWDLRSGRGIRTLSGHDGGGVTAVEIFAGSRLAISAGNDSNLKIWDLERGVELRTLTAHADSVTGVTVLGDGRRAVSSSSDGTIHVWSLDAVDALSVTKAHSGEVCEVAVLADGLRAISLSTVPSEMRAWDLATGAQIAPPVWDVGPSDSLKILPETECAEVSSDRVYRRAGRPRSMWDLASGSRLTGDSPAPKDVSGMTLLWASSTRAFFAGKGGLLAWDLPPANKVRWVTPDPEHSTAEIPNAAVYAGGRRALLADADGNVRAWDLETGQNLGSVRAHQDSVTAIAASPDSRRAVSGSKDGTVCLWDLETPTIRVLATRTDYQPKRLRETLAASVRRAVWGDDDGTITVWDFDSGYEAYSLVGHSENILALAVSADGERAVSGSQDRTVQVWDLERRDQIACFSADGSVEACALAPDGKTVIAGDRLGQVHILRLEGVSPCLPVVTAWREPHDKVQQLPNPPTAARWQLRKQQPMLEAVEMTTSSLAFGCPRCRTWSEVPESALGTELPCPNCGKPVKLNPFAIEADWRPVTAAWRGEP
jgi:WD40 repeat protein